MIIYKTGYLLCDSCSGTATSWWLRSAVNTASFRRVFSNGDVNGSNANSANGVVFGFSGGLRRKSKYDTGNQNDAEGANDLPAKR